MTGDPTEVALQLILAFALIAVNILVFKSMWEVVTDEWKSLQNKIWLIILHVSVIAFSSVLLYIIIDIGG